MRSFDFSPRTLAVACGVCLAVLSWMATDARGEDFDVPGDSTTIQGAINLARDVSTDQSDTIRVATGTYTENLTISNGSRSLIIRANDGAKVVVQAADSAAPLVEVRSALTLQRLILATPGRGVFINFTSGASLSSLVFTDASTAIDCISGTSGSTIEHNTFFQVTNGVNCSSSTIAIKNNIFSTVSGIPIAPFTVSGVPRPTFNLFFRSDAPGGERGDEIQPPDGDDLDPQFVNPEQNDFHVQEGSAAIDAGDDDEDVGAYGGGTTHTVPFPPEIPSVNCDAPPATTCTVSWTKNLDHAVTGYLVFSSAPSAPDPDFGAPVALDNAAAGCAAPATACSTTLGPLTEFSAAPATPAQPTALIGDSKVELTWPLVSDATEYDVYVGTAPNSGTFARRVSTNSARVDGLSNGTPYYFSVQAVSQPKVYVAVKAAYGTVSTTSAGSEASAPDDPAPYGTALLSQLSTEATATPQEVLGFPLLEDAGGCFIATAAYGSSLAPQVGVLRTFREHYLRPYATGRAVIRVYEAWSPPLADVIRPSEPLRLAVRVMLWPIVGLAWIALHGSWWLLLIPGTAMIMAWVGLMRRRVVRA